MENIKKLLSLVAVGVMSVNSFVFADQLPDTNGRFSIGSTGYIKIGRNTISDSEALSGINSDNTQIIIGKVEDGKFEEKDLNTVLEFNKKDFEISRTWNFGNDNKNPGYNYEIPSDKETAGVNFALKNRSAGERNVELKFTPGPYLKNDLTFDKFVELFVNGEKIENFTEQGGSWFTNVKLSWIEEDGSGNIITNFEIKVKFDALNLDGIIGKISPNDEEYTLFGLTLTLETDSSSGSGN